MLRAFYYMLWVTPAFVFMFLAMTMVRRGLRKQFSFFFSYAVFQVLSFLAQFAVYHYRPSLYFYEYWTGAALSIGLSFAVIYEVFTEVFRPFEGLRDLGGVLFRWATAVLILAAALITLTAANTPGPVSMRTVIALERSVRVMQCGIVLLMILCAPYVGLRYRHRVFGIGAGFGIMATIDLIAVAVLSRIGLSATTSTFFSLAHMAAFNFAAVLWSVYFLRPEPARLPALQLAPSERWDFALLSAMHPQSASPSLPLIMGVVDRAFERAGNEQRSSGPRKADK
jgi:hypothetical protein